MDPQQRLLLEEGQRLSQSIEQMRAQLEGESSVTTEDAFKEMQRAYERLNAVQSQFATQLTNQTNALQPLVADVLNQVGRSLAPLTSIAETCAGRLGDRLRVVSHDLGTLDFVAVLDDERLRRKEEGHLVPSALQATPAVHQPQLRAAADGEVPERTLLQRESACARHQGCAAVGWAAHEWRKTSGCGRLGCAVGDEDGWGCPGGLACSLLEQNVERVCRANLTLLQGRFQLLATGRRGELVDVDLDGDGADEVLIGSKVLKNGDVAWSSPTIGWSVSRFERTT